MTAHHAVARPLTWITGMLLTTATGLGLWFGIGAPDVSPVAAPVVQAGQADQADAAPGQQATSGDAARGAGPQVGGAGPQVGGAGQGGRGGGRR